MSEFPRRLQPQQRHTQTHPSLFSEAGVKALWKNGSTVSVPAKMSIN